VAAGLELGRRPMNAQRVGEVWLVLSHGACSHEPSEVVAVFATMAEAQGFAYKYPRYNPSVIRRTLWANAAWVFPQLPAYYARPLSDCEAALDRPGPENPVEDPA
jgi:hypothetical protein